MIEPKQLGKEEHKVIIRPNPAMPWRLIKKIYLAFAGFILIVALILSIIQHIPCNTLLWCRGIILGYALYITALKSSNFERVLVDRHEITIEFVNGKKTTHFDFVREWSPFLFTPSTETQPSEISISKSGKKLRIAQRIN